MVFSKPSVRLALLACLVLGLVAAFVLPGRRPPPHPTPEKPAPALDAAAASRLAVRVDADTSLAALLATCPADAWRSRAGPARARSVKETGAACARAPDTCLADCLEFSDGRACTALALMLQETKGADPLVAEKLFQLGCAAGDTGGCVNRAGAIRNLHYAGDPFAARPAAARHACEFRSFTLACDRDGTWGCAMRGQSYAEGEGTSADPAAARRDWAKACTLDPTFPACAFARARLAEMEAAGKPQ